MKNISSAVLFLSLGALAGCAPVAQAGDAAQAAPQTPSPATPLPSSPAAPATEAADADIPALEARVKELEAALAKAKASAPGSTDASVKQLLEMLDRRDGSALSAQMETFIVQGEPGFAVLHDFFHQTDVDHPKILALTHDLQCLFGILRVVALHPDEVARCSQYLIKTTKDRPQSFIRRELYNFVPTFLNYHKDRYPELQRDFEEDLLFQLRSGGAHFNKVFIAMRDLDFHPPPESFLPVLNDAGSRDVHGPLLKYLLSRGEEGVKTLIRFVNEARDPRQLTVRDALKELAQIDGSKGSDILKAFLESPNPPLRASAILAHFSLARSMDSYPLAESYLRSPYEIQEKRTLITVLRQRNTTILEALAGQAESFEDDALKQILKRSLPKRTPPGAQPGETSPAGKGK